MSRTRRVLGLTTVALVLTTGHAIAQRQPVPRDPRAPFQVEPTLGEERRGSWFLGIQAGLANPAGDLSELSSSGVGIGLSVGKWARASSALRLRTDVEFPGGATIEGGLNAGTEVPGWLSWTIEVGAMQDLTGGETSLMLAPTLAIGGTLLDSGDLGNRSVNQWFLSLTPGLLLGHAIGSSATFIVDARYRSLVGNKVDVAALLSEESVNLGHFQLQAGMLFRVGSR